jgi:hypothetical protein
MVYSSLFPKRADRFFYSSAKGLRFSITEGVKRVMGSADASFDLLEFLRLLSSSLLFPTVP